ncbi:MAG TPA: hypothetical protein VGH46_07235 [Gaiellaceae bacterium]
MRRGVFPVLALASALLLAGCGESRLERTYRSRNEAIIDSLPVFPGAAKTHEAETPFYGELIDSKRPAGYSTSVVYRVPRGTSSASVLRFYVTRLGRGDGWRGARIGHRPRALFVRTRDRSVMSVSTASLLHGAATYEVEVAYRGDCCRR